MFCYGISFLKMIANSPIPAVFRRVSDYFISNILSIIRESILNALYILMKIFGQTGRIFSLKLRFLQSRNYVQLIDRLTMGSRYPIPDFIGKPIQIQSLNVMTYIDKLNDDFPNARNMYDYLCVSCHPTAPQLFYWGTMYPDFNNNDVFRDLGQDMIRRTFDTMRIALDGTKTDIENTFKICLDIEETEREKQR